MQNMHVEFYFKKMARLKETLRLIFKGKINTVLTEGNILSIWKQYSEQSLKEQLYSRQSPKKVVAK